MRGTREPVLSPLQLCNSQAAHVHRDYTWQDNEDSVDKSHVACFRVCLFEGRVNFGQCHRPSSMDLNFQPCIATMHMVGGRKGLTASNNQELISSGRSKFNFPDLSTTRMVHTSAIRDSPKNLHVGELENPGIRTRDTPNTRGTVKTAPFIRFALGP